MTASLFSLLQRSQPGEVLRFLAAGQVTGLLEGGQWLDWEAGDRSDWELVGIGGLDRLCRLRRDCFHFVLATGSPVPAASLDYLLPRSRGIGLVSSHLGTLLRHAARILAPPGPPLHRTSGAIRMRASGGFTVQDMPLQIVKVQEVLRSATLAVRLNPTARVSGSLHSSFPGLLATNEEWRIPLDGRHPEEILCRLREAGLAVRASSVWYPTLQPPPRFSG